jgi:energy-coupling factor transporter ATP-binding protein EcfA2
VTPPSLVPSCLSEDDDDDDSFAIIVTNNDTMIWMFIKALLDFTSKLYKKAQYILQLPCHKLSSLSVLINVALGGRFFPLKQTIVASISWEIFEELTLTHLSAPMRLQQLVLFHKPKYNNHTSAQS